MPATNQKKPRSNKFLRASFLGLIGLFFSSGCAPTYSPQTGGDQQNSSAPASNVIPEITAETIRAEINDAYVREVPEENGANEPISWRFDEDEPKEFAVVEQQIEETRATIIINIETRSAPDSRTQRYLAGQIRTKWELQTGWMLRQWELVETENISLKYKNLSQPPPAPSSNR